MDSLSKSFNFVNPEILITDDGSSGSQVREILEAFKEDYNNKNYNKTQIVYSPTNIGLPKAKLDPIHTHIKEYGYREEFFLVSDSDMIYKKG